MKLELGVKIFETGVKLEIGSEAVWPFSNSLCHRQKESKGGASAKCITLLKCTTVVAGTSLYDMQRYAVAYTFTSNSVSVKKYAYKLQLSFYGYAKLKGSGFDR